LPQFTVEFRLAHALHMRSPVGCRCPSSSFGSQESVPGAVSEAIRVPA
jgi:hypothetical protein